MSLNDLWGHTLFNKENISIQRIFYQNSCINEYDSNKKEDPVVTEFFSDI